jgi:glycine hydroxymethyltransferase
VDLRNKNMTGKEGEERLDSVGLTVNKNTVPFETQSPFVTSGIRLGTPAITSRGMGEEEMRWLGNAIAKVLHAKTESEWIKVKSEVSEVCERFPIYKDL